MQRASISILPAVLADALALHCSRVFWLAILCVLGAPAGSEAGNLVSFRLEVPPAVERVDVTALRLLAGGAPVAELQLPIRTSGGSSTIQIGFTVDALPDAVEVEYEADTQSEPGLPTLYSVADADFAFDVPYALPVPSPGGALGPQPPADDSDVTFRLVLPAPLPPRTDFRPPSCEITTVEPGVLEIALQDQESGLALVEALVRRNVELDVPDFTPGTTDRVTATAQIVDPRRTTVLVVRAEDGERNQTVCKRVQRGEAIRRRRTR